MDTEQELLTKELQFLKSAATSILCKIMKTK